MTHTEEIHNNESTIRLVRLVRENNSTTQAWITFEKVKDNDYPEISLSWDNDNFIFTKFYKFLIRYKCNKLKDKDQKKYKEIWSILNQDVVSELIDMLHYAIERNWYVYNEVTKP